MSTVLKISDDLIEKAKIQSNVNNRSLTKQIEYWAKIGRIAEDNPDLNYDDIKNILIGVEEVKAGQISKFKFEEINDPRS